MNSKTLPNVNLLLFKLENEQISVSMWMYFIRTYCHHIYIGPWLVEGSVMVVEQLELWNRDACYGIALAANHNEPLIDTFVHELLHIFLNILEVKVHPEKRIERLGKVLSKKYPWILDIVREVFPGLKFDEEFVSRSLRKPVYAYNHTTAE